MKKVLITGGAGFIAHHLIYHILKTTDWEIISLDRLDYSGNLNRLDNILFIIAFEYNHSIYHLVTNLILLSYHH